MLAKWTLTIFFEVTNSYKVVTIGSGNDMFSDRQQAITRTNNAQYT